MTRSPCPSGDKLINHETRWNGESERYWYRDMNILLTTTFPSGSNKQNFLKTLMGYAPSVNSVSNKDLRSGLQCDSSQSLHLALALFLSDIYLTQPQHEVSCYKRESARPNGARRNPPSTAAADVTSFLDAHRNSRTAPEIVPIPSRWHS